MLQPDAPQPWHERRAAVFAALPEEEQRAIKARSEARRAAKHARKLRGIERAFRINEMVLAGKAIEQIAAAEGMTERTLFNLRKQWGFAFGKKPGSQRRRVSALVRPEFSESLDELAVDMKTDPADALGELLKIMLADDAAAARRTLCVKRRARLEAVA